MNQAGRETEDDLRRRLEAEFEVEKERLERQIQEIVEEEKRREEKLRVVGEHTFAMNWYPTLTLQSKTCRKRKD